MEHSHYYGGFEQFVVPLIVTIVGFICITLLWYVVSLAKKIFRKLFKIAEPVERSSKNVFFWCETWGEVCIFFGIFFAMAFWMFAKLAG